VIWGRARPNTAGEGSFFVGVDVQGTSSGTATGVSPTTYVVAPLRVGDPYYIDRSYTTTAMPSALAGLVGIKTANNDKTNQSDKFLTFTLTQPATLYVAYDAHATRYPTWLTASYTNTGQRLTTSDVPLSLWRREVAAGTVTLPGNLYGNPPGVASNYVVLLDFHEEEMAGDTTPVFQLEAGEHVLRIKQRDSGTQLDRLLITTDMNMVPQD
jgi:hypothetical protein